MHSVNGKGDEKNGEYKGSVYWAEIHSARSVNPDGETVTLDGDTVVWTGEEDVLTPEELEEFHRDAIKLMEESEQQKEVAIQG